MTTESNTTTCLCDVGHSQQQTYEQCCGQYHHNQAKPEDALTLMRSRYCAYAKGLADYLIETTHRENEQYDRITKRWKQSLQDYFKQMDFNGLTIIDFQPGEKTATVTFKVKMSQSGQEITLHEKSLFKKAGQRWLYYSGDTRFL